MVKAMKYELTYLDGCGDFQEMQKTIWGISKDVRTVQNKTIQMWSNWDFFLSAALTLRPVRYPRQRLAGVWPTIRANRPGKC